jgi:hypothetical protein
MNHQFAHNMCAAHRHPAPFLVGGARGRTKGMPGTDDRQPSSADRPPASRVADELQKLADEVEPGDEPDEAGLEHEAEERARKVGWDHPLTD